ncbi:MAG TPA: S8 family serine peptidase [Gaiellaceae bacterium]|nr:S8 family serine peptidase [Gaiellaceae bacterium]
MNGRRLVLGAVACAVVGTGIVGGGVARSATTGYPVVRSRTPKLDSRLSLVAGEQAAAGRAAAVGAGANEGLSTKAGRVGVVVVASPGDVSKAQQAVAAAGGSVEASAGDLSDALVPPSALVTLANDSSVARVRAPFVHEADAVDEGVALSDAGTWHTAGYTGSGVKIAIIDLGFGGYSSLLGSSLPASVTTVNHCADGFTADTVHGTGVAEIVHQMAPAAQLTLICIDDEIGLQEAEQYVVANGIKIVNHSVSWFDTDRGDGTGEPGTPDAIVADARANGVLWVNAAGNYGYDHWAGYFTPDSSQPFLNDFEPGVTGEQFQVAAGGDSCALMKWDAWPVTTEDFDLVVKRVSDGVTVASSANDQADGPAPPVEEACFTNTSGATVTYAASIVSFSVAGDPLIDLFVTGAGPISDPITQSVTEPASSPAALAVGAVCWQTGDLEGYSSRGPTIDGRTKPDLAAYDSVSTDTYGAATSGDAGCGASGFTGTSAAAPQVAGAAALLLQRSPSWTPAELTGALETRAQNFQEGNAGGVADNNQTGHGPLALGLTDPIGSILFDDGGAAFVTDGEAVSAIANYSEPVWPPFGGATIGELLARTSFGQFQAITADGNYTGHGLIATTSDDTQPAYAPDGRTVVFHRGAVSGLVKEDMYTGVVTSLGPSAASASPAWAPDDSKIAYLRTTGGSTDVWTMNTSGTGQAQLTSFGDVAAPGGEGGQLAWSPDSSKLLFVRGTGPYAIWVIDSNGTNAHALTSTGSAFAPSWSPDGTRILFVDSGSSLDVMDADGSNVAPLNRHEALGTGLRRTSWSSFIEGMPVFPRDVATVTGSAVVGEPLEESLSGYLGTPGVTFGFQWLRCQPVNLCNDIAGATDSSYTPTSADLGYFIRARLTVGGQASLLSDATDPVVPLWPMASAAPTISGANASGSTMSIATSGTWSGSPSFEYGWLRCGPSGGPCSTIAGADGSNYTLTCSDVGSTVRGAAFGENAGGFNASTSLPSAPITGSACPTGGTGGGGGGGGGGSGSALPPNMRVQWTSVSNMSPAAGSEVDFVVTVDNHGGGNGNNAHLQFTLPSTMKLTGPPYYERGSGCVGTVSVDCNFNYIANGTSTVVKFGVTVSGSGAQSITATATADRESDPSDNSATVTLQVAGGSGPPPPPPPLPKPHKGKTINGTAGANRLTGTAYADVLNGRGGNDVLSGLGGNDTLNGGTGKDRLLGGAGNDVLIPGPGADTVFGGAGNDVVRARDKTVDTIDCGTGRDTVYADKHDKVAKNCEIIHRA